MSSDLKKRPNDSSEQPMSKRVKLDLMDFGSNEYQNQYFTDVIFTTSDHKQLNFHRYILCFHPYWRRLLDGSFKETQGPSMPQLTLDCTYSIGQDFLNILRHHHHNAPFNEPINDNNIFDLYRCAHQYCVDFIVDHCIRYIQTMKFSLELFQLCRKYEIKDISDSMLAEKYFNLPNENKKVIDRKQLDTKFWKAYIHVVNSHQCNLVSMWNTCFVCIDSVQLSEMLPLYNFKNMTSSDFVQLSEFLPNNLNNNNAITLISHIFKLLSNSLVTKATPLFSFPTFWTFIP